MFKTWNREIYYKSKKIKKKKNEKLFELPRLNLKLINISKRIEDKLVEKKLNGNNRNNYKSLYIKVTNKDNYIKNLKRTEKLNKKLKKKLEKYDRKNNSLVPINLKENFFNKFNNKEYIRSNYGLDINFKFWVNNIVYDDLDIKVISLINKLMFSQQWKKIIQPYKYKHRIRKGFNEVKKSIKSIDNYKNAKLIVFAVDNDSKFNKIECTEKMKELLDLIDEKKIPYVFSSTRKELGFSIYGRKHIKTVRVSCVSIINYDGFEFHFNDLLSEIKRSKLKYRNYLKKYFNENRYNFL